MNINMIDKWNAVIGKHLNLLWHAIACLLFIGFVLSSCPLAGQSVQEKRFDFEVKEGKLTEVISQLSALAEVRFSYSTSDLQHVVPITYSGKNKTLREHLTGILEPSACYFRYIGNQIVIFKPGGQQKIDESITATTIQPEPEPAIPEPAPEKFSISLPEVLYDTIIRVDTIRMTDTIVRTDTIFIRETIVAEAAPTKPGKTGAGELDRGLHKGWSAKFYFASMYNEFSFKAPSSQSNLLGLVKESESVSFRNFSVGAGMDYHINSWTVSAALQLTGFANKFRYSYERTTGGFYDVDTLDVYYTVVLSDTSWYYITDSAYVPLDKRAYYYNQLNNFGYLDLQLAAAYTFYRYRGFGMYVTAGFNISRLIYSNGLTIGDPPDYFEVDFDDLDIVSNHFSWQAGLGINQRIAGRIDLTAEVFYRNSGQSLIDQYPVERKYQATGIKAGILYYF
ncbi:MAG: hypothetical protein Q8S18_05135 [Bacteroidales bacterium]|nr:hypothetical protein [Bacteroidales bacterium]